MRTVIIASPSTNAARRIDSFSGLTWGELRQHPTMAEMLHGNVEAILSPGNVTLSRADAALPTTDFKVFLVPTQNKAGISSAEAEEIGKAVAAAIAKGEELSGSDRASQLRETLIESVADFFDLSVNDISQSVSYPGATAAGGRVISTTSGSELDRALAESKRLI
jgi:hypothetical protein